ncbi:hypothetical protein [Bradyrhizobium sp. CCBAU 51753]|uniref:hypothetical protein n=1 Tax=Bradyrhizobium sp. CCBAU 51753 TaxID=1325100 RepID=UPI00188D14AC|nr:hypothetical protein [Bradyrhizobium sp. CCBAU 51753]QOZ25908.1 hypothetical protein XH93_21560 [Bradyrhizobium sp. CCBAU 51753]
MMNFSPFASSLELLENAKARIDDLDRALDEFSRSEPYSNHIEVHAPSGYQCAKIRQNKPIPQAAKFAARDAFHDLRGALDHAGYACTCRSNKPDRKGGFPFSKTKAHFSAAATNTGRDLPTEIRELMKSYRGYGDEDGDKLLYALNEVRNINDHRFLAPFGVVSGSSQSSVKIQITPEKMAALQNDGGRKVLLNPQFNPLPIMDPQTNEMLLAIWDERLHDTPQFEVNLHVGLGEIGVLWRHHPLVVLRTLVPKVATILSEVETEARRIGLF